MPNSTFIKFADDITVIGLIVNDDESDYRNEIELVVVKWSNDNNIILNDNNIMITTLYYMSIEQKN